MAAKYLSLDFAWLRGEATSLSSRYGLIGMLWDFGLSFPTITVKWPHVVMIIGLMYTVKFNKWKCLQFLKSEHIPVKDGNKLLYTCFRTATYTRTFGLQSSQLSWNYGAMKKDPLSTAWNLNPNTQWDKWQVLCSTEPWPSTQHEYCHPSNGKHTATVIENSNRKLPQLSSLHCITN